MAGARPLLIVLARAPVPRRVKPNLTPPLKPAQAARLYAALVEDTVEVLLGFGFEADIEIHTDRETAAWPRLEIKRALQPAGGAGERLLQTLETGLASGHAPVAVFAGDTPSLPRAHVSLLLDSNADVTFGPADDGGFYAVSCRRTHPRMFDGVRWGTADTLQDALRATEACGLSTALGNRWFDIDTPQDLKRLDGILPPRRSLAVLQRLNLTRPRRRVSSHS